MKKTILLAAICTIIGLPLFGVITHHGSSYNFNGHIYIVNKTNKELKFSGFIKTTEKWATDIIPAYFEGDKELDSSFMTPNPGDVFTFYFSIEDYRFSNIPDQGLRIDRTNSGWMWFDFVSTLMPSNQWDVFNSDHESFAVSDVDGDTYYKITILASSDSKYYINGHWIIEELPVEEAKLI